MIGNDRWPDELYFLFTVNSKIYISSDGVLDIMAKVIEE